MNLLDFFSEPWLYVNTAIIGFAVILMKDLKPHWFQAGVAIICIQFVFLCIAGPDARARFEAVNEFAFSQDRTKQLRPPRWAPPSIDKDGKAMNYPLDAETGALEIHRARCGGSGEAEFKTEFGKVLKAYDQVPDGDLGEQVRPFRHAFAQRLRETVRKNCGYLKSYWAAPDVVARRTSGVP